MIDLEHELMRALDALESAEQEVTQLRESLQASANTLQQQQEIITNYESAWKRLQSENDTLRESLQTLTNERNSLESDVQQLEALQSAFTEQLSTYQSTLNTSRPQ